MDKRIIKARLEAIETRTVLERIIVRTWRHRTADYLSPGEYRHDSPWVEHSGGPGSWPAGKTVFVALETDAPRRPGLTPRLFVDHRNMEGLLRVDGVAHCGIDSNHAHVLLPDRAVGARAVLEAELVSQPRVWSEPERAAEPGEIRSISIEYADPEIEAAAYDLRFAALAAEALEPGRRKDLVSTGLEQALLAVDLTGSAAAVRSDLLRAQSILRERIADLRPDPEQGRVYLTGHSHIDTAWLWPLKETVRKCGRTFGTAIRLMERHPSYRFSCSQPQLYAYTKQYFPDLYRDIRRLVTEGRWETTGGMWVECDCNVPSGESLIRQFLAGITFFRNELGTRPRSCWLPDVFGYPAGLPQILTGCGMRWFFTTKLHWQARNKFPYNLFRWEGVDGSTVIAHVPDLVANYNGRPTPDQLLSAVRGYQQLAAHDEVMLPYGHGDGGGGPTEEMLAFADRAQSFPGLPACRQGGAERYFADVEQADPALPTWRGELYLETHRGTYTTQARIKRANRACEIALRDAEILCSMAAAAGASVDSAALGAAWEALLLHQFHDILPGSSIGEVYDEAARALDGVLGTARSVASRAAAEVAGAIPARSDILVLNTLSWTREDAVFFQFASDERGLTLVDSRGGRHVAQRVAEADGGYVVTGAEIPSLGYELFHIEGKGAAESADVVTAAPDGMESPDYLVELDGTGRITRLYDKGARREVMARPGGNHLQLFQDGPEREAAWNVHASFEAREYAWEGPSSVEVLESGPVRAVLRVRRAHRRSRVEQDIVLWRDLPRIDFRTRVHWKERQTLLKVAFPVEVRSPEATFEVQFGAVARPTHANTSWDQEKFEVPAQRWADLSEAYYGVSLLNDCKYGYDARGGTLRLTLLRGAEWPDPHADEGDHELCYSLYPHAGDWRTAGTVERAAELNVPLRVVARPEPSGEGLLPAGATSFLRVEGPALIETWKAAEDGDGAILRLYEPCGGRGTVTVRSLVHLASVEATNLVEETLAPDDNGHPVTLAHDGRSFCFAARPFGIATFRLRGGRGGATLAPAR